MGVFKVVSVLSPNIKENKFNLKKFNFTFIASIIRKSDAKPRNLNHQYLVLEPIVDVKENDNNPGNRFQPEQIKFFKSIIFYGWNEACRFSEFHD